MVTNETYDEESESHLFHHLAFDLNFKRKSLVQRFECRFDGLNEFFFRGEFFSLRNV